MARRVSFLEIGIEIALTNLSDYLESMNSAMQKERGKWQEWVEAEAQKLDDESRDQFYDYCSDNHWQWFDVFPHLLYSSWLIAGCALLEDQLYSLCTHFGLSHKTSLSVHDIAGDGITRAQTYLKKAIGIQFPDEKQEWQMIRGYQALRNALVHNGGEVSDDRRKRLDLLLSSGVLTIDDRDRAVLSDELCQTYVKTLHAFFRQLLHPTSSDDKTPTNYRLIGSISDVWPKANAVGIKLENGSLKQGDRIAVKVDNGFLEQQIDSLRLENVPAREAMAPVEAGVTAVVDLGQIRRGREVFLVISE